MGRVTWRHAAGDTGSWDSRQRHGRPFHSRTPARFPVQFNSLETDGRCTTRTPPGMHDSRICVGSAGEPGTYHGNANPLHWRTPCGNARAAHFNLAPSSRGRTSDRATVPSRVSPPAEDARSSQLSPRFAELALDFCGGRCSLEGDLSIFLSIVGGCQPFCYYICDYSRSA